MNDGTSVMSDHGSIMIGGVDGDGTGIYAS